METEVKVAKLEEQMKELQFQMAQAMAAISILVEAENANATGENNAAVEGADLDPRARNGRIRKAGR
jgi:hypothetical protein